MPFWQCSCIIFDMWRRVVNNGQNYSKIARFPWIMRTQSNDNNCWSKAVWSVDSGLPWLTDLSSQARLACFSWLVSISGVPVVFCIFCRRCPIVEECQPVLLNLDDTVKHLCVRWSRSCSMFCINVQFGL